VTPTPQEAAVPSNIKNEKQYEALKDKGSDPHQGGTSAQKKEAGRKGGRATARKYHG
jgi:hypothetical protein